MAPGLSLEFLAVGSLSQQPDLSANAPLVPNEPRLSVFASVRYQFLPHVAPPPAPAAPPVPPPAPLLSSRLEVTVNDDQVAAVTSPIVFVTSTAGERRDLSCDTAGHCSLEDSKAGDGVVRIEAPDFDAADRKLSLRLGVPAKLDVQLVAVPPPSQLRGVVRSLDVKAVTVRVRVEPVGTDAKVDDKGSFQLDLPPGSYDVVIEAAGYVTQRRHVQVEPKGVVVLNVDLPRAR